MTYCQLVQSRIREECSESCQDCCCFTYLHSQTTSTSYFNRKCLRNAVVFLGICFVLFLTQRETRRRLICDDSAEKRLLLQLVSWSFLASHNSNLSQSQYIYIKVMIDEGICVREIILCSSHVLVHVLYG